MKASQSLTDAIITARASLLGDLPIDIGFTNIGGMDAAMMHSLHKG